MDLMKLMKERYSCRRFAEKPVPREVIRTILEAGRVAPTAHNEQPQRILVIDEKETLEKARPLHKVPFRGARGTPRLLRQDGLLAPYQVR